MTFLELTKVFLMAGLTKRHAVMFQLLSNIDSLITTFTSEAGFMPKSIPCDLRRWSTLYLRGCRTMVSMVEVTYDENRKLFDVLIIIDSETQAQFGGKVFAAQ